LYDRLIVEVRGNGKRMQKSREVFKMGHSFLIHRVKDVKISEWEEKPYYEAKDIEIIFEDENQNIEITLFKQTKEDKYERTL